MKSFLFIVFASLLSLQACKQEPAYIISGTMADPTFEGAKVYLFCGDPSIDPVPIDSAVVANGKYEFQGVVNQPQYGRIVIMHPENEQLSIYVSLALENANLAIQTDAEGWSAVSGTAFNDAYQEFLEAKREPERQLSETVDAYYEKKAAGTMTSEEQKQIEDKWDAELQVVRDIEYDFVKRNINNPAFWFNFYRCTLNVPLEKQKALLAAADAQTSEQPVFKQVAKEIVVIERIAIGKKFTDLRMSDPDGNEIALSDYAGKGKYILIDFWASWCAPCRAEMPTVKAAYDKYRSKGFEVVGVSFDGDHDAWVKAIKDLDLPWVQMSDLKGWDSAGAKAYAIHGIPSTILLDPEGIIIAHNLRGEDLHKKLAELFDK